MKITPKKEVHYFRPCIDLHQGKVRQIIGSTLSDKTGPIINFSSQKPVEWYVELYKKDGLEDGHIILLGEGNKSVALKAIKSWQGAFQLGGGMDLKQAAYWLEQGAKRIIFTSWVIQKEKIHWDRLVQLTKEFGKEKIVLDISCQKFGKDYFIMTEQWRNKSNHNLQAVIKNLSDYAKELLVHSTTMEGKKMGVDKELVQFLSTVDKKIAITYAGGIASNKDIEYIVKVGAKKLYFTVGSALDIFGGDISYYWIVKNFFKQQ